MADRLLIVTCVLALFFALVSWLKHKQMSRARAASSGLSAAGSSDQIPTLVYFWSESCGQCRSMQAPIIEKLGKAFGVMRLRVNRIDVGKEPEQAAAWGVKTIPTTYVLDKYGEVQYVNNGLATERVIRDQLDSLVV